MLRVHSSKTLKYKEHVLEIPISKVDSPVFDIISMLQEHFKLCPVKDDQPLFMKKTKGSGYTPLLYGELLGFLKQIVSNIGLKPQDLRLHSMRRSGAAFLHHLRVPLEDIQSECPPGGPSGDGGMQRDWRSLAILIYLITPPDRKASIKRVVANALSVLEQGD